MEERQIYNEFKKSFFKQMNQVKDQFSDYVFLCIGTNKVMGDSFGPFVGHFLLQQLPYKKHTHVVGNIQKNVSYINAECKIEQIYKRFESPCIIAIDSAFSREQDVGRIIVTNSKIQLGKGMGKRRYETGNIAIKGVIAKNYHRPFYNFHILKATPRQFVINLAKIAAYGICEVTSKINE